MLVLTRKANQQIRLGDDITITVLKIQNGSIRIGIDAPRDVRVLRGEIEPFDGGGEDRDQASPDAATDVTGVVEEGADGPSVAGAQDRKQASPSSSRHSRVQSGRGQAGGHRAPGSSAQQPAVATDQRHAASAEQSSAQIYQWRAAIDTETGKARVTEGTAAPLARFLPSVPPAVQENGSSYAV